MRMCLVSASRQPCSAGSCIAVTRNLLSGLKVTPRCEPAHSRTSAVACHPKQDILAAGYSDGTILMVRLHDGAEILVHKNGGAPVAALAWNAKGTTLAFAAEDGDAGLLDV